MTAHSYVFRPAPVLAWRFERAPVPDWVFDLHERQVVAFERFSSADPVIVVAGVRTLSARLGDWLVLTPSGEPQVWSDAMFRESFVPAGAP